MRSLHLRAALLIVTFLRWSMKFRIGEMILVSTVRTTITIYENSLIVQEKLNDLKWQKARVIYYTNNWIYSTNHKRIAVNYFWFVILSGIVGMVLATAIRLEFAYPGVGIFAGDSLQYLSIATAHGVIMVFFMIMPLIFGAFGNFLLPTQLGVHDVAFPRLNSAAFWFLPAGLLMLCQLVCVDKRYQRINCFNIRELQSLLKNKFFTNFNIHYLSYQKSYDSLITFRYKLNDLSMIMPYSFLSNYYNVMNLQQNKLFTYSWYLNFSPYYLVTLNINKYITKFFKYAYNALDYLSDFHLIITLRFVIMSFFYTNITDTTNQIVFFTNSLNFKALFEPNNFYSSIHIFFKKFLNLCWSFDYAFYNNNYQTMLFVNTNIIWLIKKIWYYIQYMYNYIMSINFYKYFIEYINNVLLNIEFIGSYCKLEIFQFSNTPWPTLIKSLGHTNYLLTTNVANNVQVVDNNLSSSHNNYSVSDVFAGRATKTNNLLFKYDFKAGDYLPKNTKVAAPHLYASLINITTGIKQSLWLYNDSFLELFNYNIQSMPKTINDKSKEVLLNFVMKNDFIYSIALSTFNFPTNLNSFFVNSSILQQKFNKMFLGVSLQNRAVANWRSLKFSREGWRCRLLIARNQKNLYKRYISEDNVFWSIERNAKDLLPGWAMITPFSSRTRFTTIGKVDIGLMGVFLAINASIVSSANFLVTYRYLATLNNRKMRDAKSFFTEAVMVTSGMMIAANPMLAISIIMLLADRHWQTSFFDYSGGGDTVLFQHMFWFFGHPEVYIIMVPVFGFINTIMSYALRKRVSARASLLYSMYTIAFLGFFVWGHHMYMVGLAHTTRMLFSTLTVMISVPAATKLMHWCVTLVNSAFYIDVPLLNSLTFVFLFVSGGISGMCVAHTGMDVLFHDTFYVIGHFHVMLAGSALIGSFGGFYFYFPSIFGVKYSRLYAYLHYMYYLIGQLMTVIPMFWLGYAGMPRRVLDFPAVMGGWHSVISAGHLLSVAGMMAFFVMIFDSLRQAKAVVRNTFGISRFNTRLNFYLYEFSRNQFNAQKGFSLFRYTQLTHLWRYKKIISNFETYETVLITYDFSK